MVDFSKPLSTDFIIIYASVGGTIILMVAAFFVARAWRRRVVLKHLMIPSSSVVPIESMNWVWPELLDKKNLEVDTGQVYRNLSDSSSNNEGPRSAPSVVQVALYGSQKFIFQKYKMKDGALKYVIKPKKTKWGQVADLESQESLEEEETAVVKIKRSKDRLNYIRLSKVNHPNILSIRHLAIEESFLKVLYDPTGKGTLEDVMLSRRFQLNDTIKYSLILDIINGLDFLHNSKFGFHGTPFIFDLY